MTYHVSVSSKCEMEIADAADWWADNRDPDQASDWLEGIHEKLATLSKNPDRLPIIREQSRYVWKHTYHRILYGLGKKPTHRVIYRIQADTVCVVTIRHLAQRDITPDDVL